MPRAVNAVKQQFSNNYRLKYLLQQRPSSVTMKEKKEKSMTQSYDWLLFAKYYPEFAEKLQSIIESSKNTDLRMDYLLLHFDGERQVMSADKADPEYIFNHKITELEISYADIKRYLFELSQD